MYRPLLSAFSLSIALLAGAQSYVHQVLVLNEGHYDMLGEEQLVPVTLGSYDPATAAYQTVATIEGSRFGSDVLVHGPYIFVAADNKLLKFDLDTYALVDEAQVQGIRKIDVWNDLILITRGELGGLPHYFEVREADGLELVETITPADGLPHSVEDVVVADGKAWLAVNNSFDWEDLTGYIAVVDLATMTLDAPIDLGPDGINPEKIMVAEDAIYVLNNTDFTGSSMSKISRQNASLHFTDAIALNSGCGASALAVAQEKVYFMEYAVNTLARYDIATDAVLDTLQNGISAYGLLDDPINGVMYVTTTDFFSTGELHVMQHDGSTSGTVAVGVSPGHLALDVRTSTGMAERGSGTLGLYPNPVVDRFTITGADDGTATITILDATGRSVLTGTRTVSSGRLQMDVSALPAGLYIVQLNGAEAVRFARQ